MAQNNASIAENFLDLRQRLAEWRTNHPRRTPLPEQFWMEAAEQKTASPQFLELFPAPAGTSYCVEVLRVRDDGALDWSELLRAWGQPGQWYKSHRGCAFRWQ